MRSPEFVKKLQPCRVLDGEQAQFECSFTGEPEPYIIWIHETTIINPSSLYSIKTQDNKSTLTIKCATIESSGVYTVKAENRAGSAKSSANLMVTTQADSGHAGGYVIETIREPAGGRPSSSCSITSTTCDGRLITYTSNNESLDQDSTLRHTTHDMSLKLGEMPRYESRMVNPQYMEAPSNKDGQLVSSDRVHKMVLESDLPYTLLILECSHGDGCSCQCASGSHNEQAICEPPKLSITNSSQFSDNLSQRSLSANESRSPDMVGYQQQQRQQQQQQQQQIQQEHVQQQKQSQQQQYQQQQQQQQQQQHQHQQQQQQQQQYSNSTTTSISTKATTSGSNSRQQQDTKSPPPSSGGQQVKPAEMSVQQRSTPVNYFDSLSGVPINAQTSYRDKNPNAQEVGQLPRFLTHITDYVEKAEGESVHFECCLSPVDDPNLKTEWFFNGRPLVTGSRFHTMDDFGFVVLDIDWLFPRDTGEYVCRATNKFGTDITRTVLRVKPDKSIVLDSQLDNPTIIHKLRQLEFPDVPEEAYFEEPDTPAHFVQHLRTKNNRQQFIEGDNVYFEARVGPVTDGNLTVEWFHNDKPLISGHRFKPSFDFGYIVLEILYVYAEDSGVYKCVAQNSSGTDVSQFKIHVTGKPSLIYQSQLPKEMVGGVQKITDMEAMWNKPAEPEAEAPPLARMAPEFVLKPKACVAFEGSCARFCCRIVGNPRPRLTWILNGQTIVSGSRYKLTHDGMYHLTIAKCLLTDAGRLEVYARNLVGECFATTELEVRRKVDDYRGVLKNSPKPWYDEQSLKVYQRHRSSQDSTDDEDNNSLYDIQQRHQLQMATQQQEISPTGGNQLIGYMDADAPDVRLLAQRYSPLMEQGDLHPVVAEQQVIMAPAPSTIQRALKSKDSIKSAEKSFHLPPETSNSRRLQQQQQLDSTNSASSYQDLSQEQQQAHVFGLDLPRYSAGNKPGSHSTNVSRAKSPKNEQKQQMGLNQEQYQDWLHRQQLEQQRMNRISASEERMLFGALGSADQWSRQQSPAPYYDSRLPPPSPESVVHGREVHSHTHKQRQLERRPNKEIMREIIEKETFEQEHKGVTKDNLVRGSSLDRQSTPESVRSQTVSLSSRDNFNQAYNPYTRQQQLSNADHSQSLATSSNRQVHFQDEQQLGYGESEVLIDESMTPPEFVQKIQPCQALDGEQAQFECTFIGDPSPTISWFRETKLIKPSNLYSIITNDNKSILIIKRVGLHANAVYTVKAENGAGSAKSSANLVVEPHPEPGHPAGRLVETIRVIGGPGSSSTSSSNSKAGLLTSSYTTSSESSSQLADRNSSLAQETSTFSDSDGGGKVVKSVKTRRLRADEVNELIRASPEGVMAPTFIHTIHDLSVKLGELARLDARLVGSQPMEVRWLKNGQRIRADRVHKMVLEGDLYTLLILECSPKDEGIYQCVASNQIGEATCEAKLTVISGNQFGDSNSQSPVSANGSRSPVPQQQYNLSSTTTTTTSGNNYSYQRETDSVSPSGQQRQHFGVPKHHYSPLMNQYTSLSGGRESGRQQEVPKLIKGLENQEVREGKSVTLRCQISSFPIPEVHWYKHGDKLIKPSKFFRIFKDNDETYCLKILETYAEDQGEYKCVARAPSGQMNVETRATVTVIPNSPIKN